MTKVVAAIVVVLLLALSRVLAILANQWLWLRVLARTPPGVPRGNIAREIYLPATARKGLWPGLVVFFPIMWAGLAIGDLDRSGVLFYVGMSVAVVGGVLAAGAIWSIQASPFPNKSLAEARIKAIDQALDESATTEPIGSYRQFWRASYLWELVTCAESSSHKESPATLRSVERFLDRYERDLAEARTDPADDRVLGDVEKLASANAEGVSAWRARIQEADSARAQLIANWPAAAKQHPAGVRIKLAKSYTSVKGVAFDGVDLTDLLIARKQEAPIVVSSLDEARSAPSAGKGLSRPWIFDFDVVIATTPGPHTLALELTRDKRELSIDTGPGGPTVALLSFDLYSDTVVSDVYSAAGVS